jgi:hypothetical protein
MWRKLNFDEETFPIGAFTYERHAGVVNASHGFEHLALYHWA